VPEREQNLDLPELEPVSAGETEPPASEYSPSPGAQFSLARTAQLLLILVIAGWFTYLYFTNDNIPVRDYRLGSMLPKTPEGWRRGLTHSGNPSSVSIGVGAQFEKFTSSNAWRTYSQGDKEITVEIWDWAGDYPYHMPIDVPGWANGEPVRVGAEEGRLRYNPAARKGRLRVRYLDRFYLIVEGEGIDRHELDGWYRRIDLAGLRNELDQLRRTTASR
jgi:hypothetical protein